MALDGALLQGYRSRIGQPTERFSRRSAFRGLTIRDNATGYGVYSVSSAGASRSRWADGTFRGNGRGNIMKERELEGGGGGGGYGHESYGDTHTDDDLDVAEADAADALDSNSGSEGDSDEAVGSRALDMYTGQAAAWMNIGFRRSGPGPLSRPGDLQVGVSSAVPNSNGPGLLRL